MQHKTKQGKTFSLGFIGLGTVGSGTVAGLHKNAELIARRTGIRVQVKAAAVRRMETARDCDTTGIRITTDPFSIVRDPGVDIVVELMGGQTLACELVLEALRHGKSVVTANKALICEHGPEIFAAARQHGGKVFFEASVAGGIPIIKVVREALAGNDVQALYGILNGTCNYILTQMGQGKSYASALASAQQKGYAEADPTLDVDGGDTAHKAAILASLIYGRWFQSDKLRIEGIRKVSSMDISLAAELGRRIKLLAILGKDAAGQVSLQVSPALVKADSLLGTTMDVYNGIKVYGDVVGETMFYGMGAGKDPTSSSVIADIIEACQALNNGSAEPGFTAYEGSTGLKPAGEYTAPFMICLQLKDSPMSLSALTSIPGNLGVNIASVQHQSAKRGHFPVALVTYTTNRDTIDHIVRDIRKARITSGPITVYPILDIS